MCVKQLITAMNRKFLESLQCKSISNDHQRAQRLPRDKINTSTSNPHHHFMPNVLFSWHYNCTM